MLSMIILCPKQPKKDKDVYLNPLIKDLRVFWEEDVDVDDVYTDDNFKICVMLFCIINDFPAYSNLSGYNVKGHKACPICEDDTCYHLI